MQRYRHVLRVPGLVPVLVLGLLVRMPFFAAGLVLTVHVVSTLGRSYGEAGLVSAAFTIALALSAPWRGRLLDRLGLRRTLAPSIAVTAVVWTVQPFLPYAALLAAAVLSGAFAVPTFSILRQALLAIVPLELRRSALSLDSVSTELAFMIGPAVAVWAAATYDTRWVLVVIAALAAASSVALYVVDPTMTSPAPTTDGGADGARIAGASGAAEVSGASGASGVSEDSEDSENSEGQASWVSLGVLAVLGAAAASTVVLGGTDVSIVAALRATGQPGAIGWVLSVWGAGSLLGGLAYGALHRPISVFWLLGGLAATTLPVALAPHLAALAVLLFVCGGLCAPTITATIDGLSRLVPEHRRGEAMGWHGSAMTAGQALGAPLAGFAIDLGGWGWGFVSVSLLGLGVAVVGGAAAAWRRRPVPARA